MLFGPGLSKILCDHKGPHEAWCYKIGTGITELSCSKCGKVILKIALDDLPKYILRDLVVLLKKKNLED